MNQEMIQDAQEAARCVASLKAMSVGGRGPFNLTGASISGPKPQLHVHESVLDQISDKEDWTWTTRGTYEYPIQGQIELFDVVFFAIFHHDEAAEYGCPQGVLDEASDS